MIWESLKFFTTRLQNLPVSKTEFFYDDKGYCVSVGCPYEGWVFYQDRIKRPLVIKEALEFFEGVPFVWPVYSGGESLLEEAGLTYGESLTGMIFDNFSGFCSYEPDEDINITVTFCSDSRQWARAYMLGFYGSLESLDEKFFAFTDSLFKDPFMRLGLAYLDGELAGSFALTLEENCRGVYYFSTVPDARRMGVATAMMDFICKNSGGLPVVLQATEMGLSFYKKFGFKEFFKIPAYSWEG